MSEAHNLQIIAIILNLTLNTFKFTLIYFSTFCICDIEETISTTNNTKNTHQNCSFNHCIQHHF